MPDEATGAKSGGGGVLEGVRNTALSGNELQQRRLRSDETNLRSWASLAGGLEWIADPCGSAAADGVCGPLAAEPRLFGDG